MTCGKEAVDIQHGTGVEGSSHPCAKHCHHKLGFFCSFKRHTYVDYSLCAINMLLCYSYFCPLQVKSKPGDGDAKHAFILGPTSLVANIYFENIFLGQFHFGTVPIFWRDPFWGCCK
jgi:hypothetical protein